MTKAAFLTVGGEPFTTLMVHKLFRERWYEEVDRFYINFNNNAKVPPEVVVDMFSQVVHDPKVNLIYHPEGIGNGPPFTELTKICREDLILMLEDDGFIFDGGYVDECFKRIESGEVDALGSPRFSSGAELGQVVAEKFHLNYSGYGDVGPNFWPNFFFCKREDLLKTDLNFASKSWEAGEYEPLMDYTFKEREGGDTFVWLGLQLRYNGVRFGNISQHHADPYEIEHRKTREGNWHNATKPFHWIHGGSLSSGWGGYLSGRVPDTSSEIAKLEMETRVAFWKLCMDEANGFDAFKVLYIAGIQNLVDSAGLDWGRINNKITLYREVMKL